MPNDYSFLLSNNLTKGQYTLFACGDNAPSAEDLKALEAKIGYALPTDFKDFSMSGLGGLYVEVNEDLWPRPQLGDVAPFWTFLYGLYVYGISGEVPEWMDIREYAAFQQRAETNYLPFMKIMGNADVFCFGPDKQIYQWDHETGEFNKIEDTFIFLLNDQLSELEERKERRIQLSKSS